VPQFSVTTQAEDLTLLSEEELRVAAGLSRDDESKDETLAEYGAEVAAEITQDCGVTSDGVHPPTLRSEVCEDTFRLKCVTETLYLSRRHVTAIESVTEDGVVLAVTDFRLEAETGRLVRLISDKDGCWTASKIVVAYTAGFAIVPDELKAEAKSRIQIKVSENSRDPLARTISTEIPDIETRTIGYQVGGLSRLQGGGLSDESERRLKRFMTFVMVG
jgi:hypothetical protein